MQHKPRIRKFTYLAATAVAGMLIAVGAPLALAADQTVNVVAGEDLYDDQNVSLSSGDTITWQNEGTHDVKSARIPSGATAWASPIQQGNATFSQSPTVAGNYRYYCTLHSSVAAANAATQSATEMVGQFTVAAGGGGAPPPAADPPAADPPAADPPAADPPAGDDAAPGDAQADAPDEGGVATGGGSTAGPDNVGILMLGGGLLLAASISVLFGFGRIARRN